MVVQVRSSEVLDPQPALNPPKLDSTLEIQNANSSLPTLKLRIRNLAGEPVLYGDPLLNVRLSKSKDGSAAAAAIGSDNANECHIDLLGLPDNDPS